MGDWMIKGRGLAPGKSRGAAVVCDQFISPLGEIGRDGTLNNSNCQGMKLPGKIFVFKGGKGSTVGSYVFLDLKGRGLAPAGIINESAEQMIVTGATISEIPMVDSIPIDIFYNGDIITIDGKSGNVSIENVTKKKITTVYLMRGDRLLLMKRSDRVSTYPSQYGGISGYMEANENPEQTGKREILEETGISDAETVAEGKAIYVRNNNVIFEIYPVLMVTSMERVELNWENSGYEWIKYDSVDKYETVPKFAKTFQTFLPVIRQGKLQQ